MNGAQISHLLSMDYFTGNIFDGFAMRDSKFLPGNENKTPALYILNTDLENGRGEHWCAAYYENDNVEFFDPFGFPPSFHGFNDLLHSRNYNRCRYNPYCVQHPLSKFCGHHCLFFAHHRCRGLSFSSVLALYDKNDTQKNDHMVLDFVLQFGRNYRPL